MTLPTTLAIATVSAAPWAAASAFLHLPTPLGAALAVLSALGGVWWVSAPR